MLEHLKFRPETFNYFKNVNIISFNYTTPLTYLINKKLCSYRNVHGKLCSDECNSCESSNIIFGIDDQEVQRQSEENQRQDERNNLRLFSKTYRTLFLDENKIKILPPKNELSTIKFFGHSLSEADHSYFQSIFDYYNIYDSNIVLKFYYTRHKDNIETETVDAVYYLLNQYGKTFYNPAQGKNLVHKLILENRIKIEELSQ